jgi:hypothetical protein
MQKKPHGNFKGDKIMKLTRLFIILLFCLLFTTNYAYAERPRIYALTNAKIVVAPGKTIEKGTIVLRDGLIEAVGENITIPPDAVQIDASGKTIYPGLIDIDVALKTYDALLAILLVLQPDFLLVVEDNKLKLNQEQFIL